MENKLKLSPYDGKIAFIVGDHPHAGAIATCLGYEETPVGLGLKFNTNDTSEEYFVFKPNHIDWLNTK